jgi:putative sugar O-methyltransferase
MTIAILRTAQATKSSYTILEYAAARFGARIVGYVDPADPAGEFRGWSLLDPTQLARAGVDLVVSPTAFPEEARTRLASFGLPDDRMMSWSTQRAECQRHFESGPWLVDRRPAVETGGCRIDTRIFRMHGVAVDPMPSQLTLEAHRDLASRLSGALRAARRDAPEAGPFAIGSNWGEFLRATRPAYYHAVQQNDVAAIAEMLAGCFRNELTTGIFGGRPAFETFARAGRHNFAGIRQLFNVWRHSVAHVDLARVASPWVGNPYGVWIGEGIVHANTFVNDYRAAFISELLGGHERPIVVELGGGFGGFGHQLFAQGGAPVYVDFDLPDNLIVASYFLAAAHPDKRVWLYDGSDDVLDGDRLREYDIVLMPNFMLPRLADGVADAFVNFISLSEMPFETIAEYLQQIDRVCAGIFYQENLLDNGDSYEAYPMWTFPQMGAFRRLYSAPSRWPFFSPTSPMHCHGEQLFLRRDLDTTRYLDLVTDRLECESAA